MAESSPEYIRLHITPFNASLLNAILPPSILPNARNISYHSLETLPEKAYGYVELPKMDADKIKKKLNGSILKGTKVKIETAKPRKVLALDPEDLTYPKKEKPLEDSKKRKRGQETIPAAEIGDRSVKRGWTTPTAAIIKKDKSKDTEGKKPVVKSRYTTGPECLFKTVLPPNVAANVKGKLDKEGKEKKKRRAENEMVVHEFAKTTKYATFLRGPAGSQKGKGVVEFVEGKGWVDEDGNVVEIVKEKKRPARKVVEEEHKKSTLDDESSEVSSSSEDECESSGQGTPPQPTEALVEDSPTSSSGSSSEDSESEASSSEDGTDAASSAESSSQEAHIPKITTIPPISTSRPQSSSGLSIKIPDSGISTTPITNSVHPLEALYKRARPGSLDTLPKPATSSFSFFSADNDNDNDNDDLEEELRDQVPLTPFTQKDFEFRGLRSAAPTPDTAHANKRFIWPTNNDDEDEEGDEAPSSPVRKDGIVKDKGKGVDGPIGGKEGKGGEAESDFQKWFYENRGETTRAWKKRRKVVGKEKRQRENRKRNDRAF